MRAALGARRSRLVRLLLVESSLLALGGGMLGALVARWAIVAFLATNPEPPPYWVTFEVGGTGILFVLGVCVLATLACGLVPALRMSRLELRAGLATGGSAAGGLEQRRAQAGLVIAQIAASLALLVGATLLTHSALRVDSVSGGFAPGPLLSLRVYLAGDAYDDDGAKARALLRVSERLAALPGAAVAAATGAIPTDDGGATVEVVPDPATPASEATGVEMVPITDGLFSTLGVAFVAGRTFTPAEVIDREAEVAIVNRRLAAAFWPGVDPLGRRIGLVDPERTRWLRVVGVAPDLVYEEIGEETPQAQLTLYRPCSAVGWRTMALLVRTQGDPAPLAAMVPRALREIDPGLAAYDVLTMQRRRVLTAWRQRFLGRVFGGFAVPSLLLACVGTYGLISYTAGRRQREMGVRLAIGARGGDIVRMLLGEGAWLAAAGTLIGLPLALFGARTLRSQLYQVSPLGPRLVGAAAGSLARRDPARLLRAGAASRSRRSLGGVAAGLRGLPSNQSLGSGKTTELCFSRAAARWTDGRPAVAVVRPRDRQSRGRTACLTERPPSSQPNAARRLAHGVQPRPSPSSGGRP